MISVFQVFRALIGIIVFVVLITFFLRITEMYTGTQIRGGTLETISTFDQVAMQTYTSGNPSTFSGFMDFDFLVYDPPKIKSDAGQKTLSSPVFFIPGKGKILLERHCLDYEWFRFCWVYAFPEAMNIIFTPVINTPEARKLIRDAVDDLPESMEFGFCNVTDARVTGKSDFLRYLAAASGLEYRHCEAVLPKDSRLVVIESPPYSFPSGSGVDVVIDPPAAKLYEGNSTGGSQSRTYRDAMEVAVFITGGTKALDFKREVLSVEIGTATKIMKERTVLVSQKMKEYNRQQCLECSTPFPKACGWIDHNGLRHESAIYRDFITSLDSLKASIASGNYLQKLNDTAVKYGELRNQGCER